MLLNFRLGSIPVRVHGSFLLIVAMLGLNPGLGLLGLAQWIVVVFVGVLLHELGHALVGRSFGLTPQIDLVGFGGLTSWSAGNARELGAGKRIAISLAGPFTGIAIGVGYAIYLRTRAGLPPFSFFDHETPDSTIVFVNAWWGVLNLLPILPMDGGNVLFQSLNWLTKGRGEKPARLVSAAIAVVAAVCAYVFWKSIYGAGLAGIFAFQNIQAYRAASAREDDAPLRERLKAGFGALEHGDPNDAIRVAGEVLSQAADPAVRTDGVRLLAFGYLLSRRWEDLAALMESPASSVLADAEMSKFEQAAKELEQPAVAERLRAVRERRRSPKF